MPLTHYQKVGKKLGLHGSKSLDGYPFTLCLLSLHSQRYYYVHVDQNSPNAEPLETSQSSPFCEKHGLTLFRLFAAWEPPLAPPPPIEALQPLEDILSNGMQTLPAYAEYNLAQDHNPSSYSNQKSNLPQEIGIDWANQQQHANGFDFSAQDPSLHSSGPNYEFGIPRCQSTSTFRGTVLMSEAAESNPFDMSSLFDQNHQNYTLDQVQGQGQGYYNHSQQHYDHAPPVPESHRPAAFHFDHEELRTEYHPEQNYGHQPQQQQYFAQPEYHYGGYEQPAFNPYMVCSFVVRYDTC